ncbi:MAG: hypothetical protein IT319_00590 [Anaerolineae bacterium]|nr:hypothetical protein [Anaerolineae bacterium]
MARAKRRGERDTSRYWFRYAKSTMWITLILWLATAALGVVSYLTRYNVIPAVAVNISVVAPLATDELVVPPIATEELLPTAEATAEQTMAAPVATAETDAAGETPEAAAPVTTPDVTAEAPVETPEVSAPAETPEVAAPVETPEVSDDFRVEGTIEALGSTAVIVDGQRYELSGARIDDVLRVGAAVRMEVHREGERLIVERIRLRDDD